MSAARAFIADPHLFQHIDGSRPGTPVCGYCNGCIARHGGRPVDCYSPQIAARKHEMLALATAIHKEEIE